MSFYAKSPVKSFLYRNLTSYSDHKESTIISQRASFKFWSYCSDLCFEPTVQNMPQSSDIPFHQQVLYVNTDCDVGGQSPYCSFGDTASFCAQEEESHRNRRQDAVRTESPILLWKIKTKTERSRWNIISTGKTHAFIPFLLYKKGFICCIRICFQNIKSKVHWII